MLNKSRTENRTSYILGRLTVQNLNITYLPSVRLVYCLHMRARTPIRLAQQIYESTIEANRNNDEFTNNYVFADRFFSSAFFSLSLFLFISFFRSVFGFVYDCITRIHCTSLSIVV